MRNTLKLSPLGSWAGSCAVAMLRAVIAVSPAAMAATTQSQMKVSLTVVETCSAQLSGAEAAVSCLHQSRSRISYGEPFAAIQDVTGNAVPQESAHIVEIAF
jgi:hypothetical protein